MPMIRYKTGGVNFIPFDAVKIAQLMNEGHTVSPDAFAANGQHHYGSVMQGSASGMDLGLDADQINYESNLVNQALQKLRGNKNPVPFQSFVSGSIPGLDQNPMTPFIHQQNIKTILERLQQGQQQKQALPGLMGTIGEYEE